MRHCGLWTKCPPPVLIGVEPEIALDRVCAKFCFVYKFIIFYLCSQIY